MTIADAREKCKTLLARVPRDILILGVLVLVSTLSFGLGYLAGVDARSVSVPVVETFSVVVPEGEGQVVASKSGTKYYLPECVGANRISENNKVWFASPAAAAAAGYAPAANCKGI